MKKGGQQNKNPQQQQQQKSPAKANRGKRGAQKVADTGAQEAKPVKQQVAKTTQQPKQTSQPNKQEKPKQQQQGGAQQKQKQPQGGAQQKQTQPQGGKKQQQQQQQGGKKQQQQKTTTTRGGGQSAQEVARSKQRLDLIIRSKYQNPDKEIPSQLESLLCQYLVDLEASNKDLKTHLRDLGIVAAREIEVTPNKKAIMIFVPYIQHSRWQKIQDRVTRELEKKFSGQEVIFVAQRKVVKLNQIKNAPRDRHTTITAVHENLLNDIVYPTKIIGKRIRFRVGGKRILKVYLDPKNSKEIESRLSTYEIVYNKLTRKIVKFMFPRYTI